MYLLIHMLCTFSKVKEHIKSNWIHFYSLQLFLFFFRNDSLDSARNKKSGSLFKN